MGRGAQQSASAIQMAELQGSASRIHVYVNGSQNKIETVFQ